MKAFAFQLDIKSD